MFLGLVLLNSVLLSEVFRSDWLQVVPTQCYMYSYREDYFCWTPHIQDGSSAFGLEYTCHWQRRSKLREQDTEACYIRPQPCLRKSGRQYISIISQTLPKCSGYPHASLAVPKSKEIKLMENNTYKLI